MSNYSNSILSLKYVFGINNIPKNLELLDSNKIFYIVGHYIIKYNVEEKTQQFIKGNEGFEEITCFSLSKKKNIIVFAERSIKPVIFIRDSGNLKKKGKDMELPDNFAYKIEAYTLMTFSNENENTWATLSEGENSIILLWNVETKKLINYIFVGNNYNIKEIKFDYSDFKISVCGENIFKIYEIEQGKILKNNIKLPNEDSYNFTSHIWQLENIILGNDKGEIHLLNTNGDYITSIIPKKNDIFSIYCLKNYINGFLVSGSHFNLIQYEYIDGNPVKTKSIFYDDNDKKEISLIDFSIDYDKEKLIILGNNKIFYTGYWVKKDDIEIYDKEIVPISNQGHLSEIYSLDICIRKSLFATCSSDKTVKIWNYITKNLEYNISFAEEPLSVAIHPSGYYIAISFTDKVKILNLFLENIEQKRSFRELNNFKGCKEVKFSNGGHLLAIVSGNPQIIQIKKFYNIDNVNEIILKGHSGKIRSLEFSKDDLYLYSSGYDGLFFQWKLSDLTRMEIITKGPPINDIALSNDDKSYFLAFQNNVSLVEYSEKVEKYKVKDESIFSTISITGNNKMIFTGISDGFNNKQENKKKIFNSGCIKYFRNPIKSNNKELFIAHNYLGVEKIKINFNDQFLISIGKDTSICLFEIKDKENKGIALKEGYKEFSKEILITKQEIEELKSKIDQLKIIKNDNQTQKPDLKYNQIEDKILNLEEIIKKNENMEIIELTSLKKQRDNYKSTKEGEIINLNKVNEEQTRELEHHFNKELSKETERIDQMRDTLKNLENQKEKELEDKIEEYENEINKNKNHYENELKEKEDKKSKLIEEIDNINNNHGNRLNIIKDDINKEEESLVKGYSSDINKLREEFLRNKNSLNKYLDLQKKDKKKINDLEESKKEQNQKLEQLNKTLDDLIFKKKEQEKEMQKKNHKITEKEKKIYDLKKTTQELEKYKFVLDFKIKDLKKDIAPRELEIIKLKKIINDQDDLLKDFNNKNSTFTKIVKTLDKEVIVLSENINKQKKKILEKNNRINKLQKHVFDSIQLIQNYDELKKKILSIKFLKKNKVKINQNIIKESDMQIKYLANAVNKMKKTLEKDTKYHNDDKMNIMKENAKLIRDISTLRDNIKSIKTIDKKDLILLEKRNINRKKKKNHENLNGNYSFEEERREIKEYEKKIQEQEKLIYNLKNNIDFINIK